MLRLTPLRAFLAKAGSHFRSGHRLGSISKRGNGYLRRLLVNGAMAVLRSKRGQNDPWLQRLLAEKKRLVVACALANKMARIGWAVMVREDNFRTAAAAA